MSKINQTYLFLSSLLYLGMRKRLKIPPKSLYFLVKNFCEKHNICSLLSTHTYIIVKELGIILIEK